MEYICHRRYRSKGASGEWFNIRRGTKLGTVGNFIAVGSKAVCVVKSEAAYMYFARNDDGRGIERGELTNAIAYSPQFPHEEDGGYRFSEKQREVICTEYPQFLRDDVDTIIFNYDFFNAEVEELKEMRHRLEVVKCIQ